MHDIEEKLIDLRVFIDFLLFIKYVVDEKLEKMAYKYPKKIGKILEIILD